SSPIVEYFSTTGLLEMSKTNLFHKTFYNVVENINDFNSRKNMLYRHQYAKENTYKNQILKIENHITNYK
ncbi:MAG: hypothetical protein P8Q14_09550, partial [Vicingaceae bacterium]|nr:hypothetical protein [Vicingaceae bacterium]